MEETEGGYDEHASSSISWAWLLHPWKEASNLGSETRSNLPATHVWDMQFNQDLNPGSCGKGFAS